jgi:hypothetical protein
MHLAICVTNDDNQILLMPPIGVACEADVKGLMSKFFYLGCRGNVAQEA